MRQRSRPLRRGGRRCRRAPPPANPPATPSPTAAAAAASLQSPAPASPPPCLRVGPNRSSRALGLDGQRRPTGAGLPQPRLGLGLPRGSGAPWRRLSPRHRGRGIRLLHRLVRRSRALATLDVLDEPREAAAAATAAEVPEGAAEEETAARKVGRLRRLRAPAAAAAARLTHERARLPALSDMHDH